jgi:hypothetical protein
MKILIAGFFQDMGYRLVANRPPQQELFIFSGRFAGGERICGSRWRWCSAVC